MAKRCDSKAQVLICILCIGCNCFHCETVGRMDIWWHQAADMQSDCYFSSYLEGLLLSYGLSVANDGYVS
jgi:hypothetical protein